MTKNIIFLVVIVFFSCTTTKEEEYPILENEDTLYNCRDKKDNDLDQLIDCNDPDCSTIVYCAGQDDISISDTNDAGQEDITISDTFVRDSNIDTGIQEDNNIQDDIIISDANTNDAEQDNNIQEDIIISDTRQDECTINFPALDDDCPINTYCERDDQEYIYKCIPGCRTDSNCGPSSTCKNPWQGINLPRQCCTDADNDRYYPEEGCAQYVDVDDHNPNCTINSTDNDGDNYCIGFDCNNNNSYCNTDCEDANNDGIQDCNFCPENIHEVGRSDEVHPIRQMVKEGNYIYTAVGIDGFIIFDITDPTAPQKVGEYIAKKDGYTMEVYSVYLGGQNRAYVTARLLGLRVLDYSDISNIREIDSDINGTIPLVIDRTKELLYTPLGVYKAFPIQQIQLLWMEGSKFFLGYNKLYVTNQNGLMTYDITNVPIGIPDLIEIYINPAAVVNDWEFSHIYQMFYATTGDTLQLISEGMILDSYTTVPEGGSDLGKIFVLETEVTDIIVVQHGSSLFDFFSQVGAELTYSGRGRTNVSTGEGTFVYNPPYLYISSRGIVVYSALCQD